MNPSKNCLAWTWLALLCLLPFGLSAQLSLGNLSSPASLTTCGTGIFQVNISRTGSFAALDSVRLDLLLPSGIELGGSWGSTMGTISPSAGSTAQHPLFTVKNFPSGTSSFEFFYVARAACGRFSPSTSPSLVNTVQAALNAAPYQSLNSGGYNVTSAWVVFDPGLSQNLNYTGAPFLVPYVRTYVFRNTSPVPFTGDFVWRDTVQFDQTQTAIRIDTATVAHPALTLLSSFVNDSTAEIRARITGLAQGDSIVIRETVRLIDCPNGINFSSAFMSFNYGCINDASPCIATPVPNFQTYALVTGAPGISMNELNAAGNGGTITWGCPAVPETRIVLMRNSGASASDTLFIRVNRPAYGNISYFKASEVRLYRLVAGNPVYLTPAQTTYEYLYIPSYYVDNDSTTPYQMSMAFAGPFLPNDTVYLSYLEHKACIDSTQYRFGESIGMNGINELGQFGHPCYPTGWVGLTHSPRGVWGYTIQTFGLQQVFENHTAFLNDMEEAWMNIDNKTPLTLNINHPYFTHEVAVNPSGLSFQVEISIEQGLGLIDQQLYLISNQNGVDSIWYPDNLSFNLQGADTAEGSTIVATFNLPSYFFLPNPSGALTQWGAQWRKSPSFDKFFNRFSVQFKVGSDCRFVAPNSLAAITQRTFLTYDDNCSPECRFPLSEVGDLISIHCPGCRVPGWNLNALSLHRINFGYADVDNDNHPDALTGGGLPTAYASAPPARDRRVMIGDTLRLNVGGFTSNGDVLRFDNIGFDYRSAWFKMTGDINNKVDFIGGHGTLNGATFTLPGNRETNTASGLYIDLSLDTLASTVSSGSLPPRFWANDLIDLELDFVVTQNMVNGGSYFTVEDIVGFIEMSGVPRTQTIGDAGPTEALILGLTPAQRAQYFYWCTGGEGRITGIGSAFNHSVYSVAHDGIWGVTAVDFCYKKLRSQTYHDVGEPQATGFWNHDVANQTALNSFSYEVRDFILVDSISYTLPAGWEVARVDIRISNIMRDTVSNLTRYVSSPDWYAPFHIPPSMVSHNGNVATIYPHQYYDYISDPAIYMANSGMNQLDHGDETKRIQMDLILKMTDCETTPASVNMSNGYPVTTYLDHVPSQFGDTMVLRQNMPNGTVINRPDGHLQAQILPANLNTSVSNLTWGLNLSLPATPGRWYDQDYAANTFVYAYSPSGNINITNVRQPGSAYYFAGLPRVDTIAGHTLYGLGNVWQSSFVNLSMDGTYSCANVESVDSIYVIYGWNCYGYPSSIEAACSKDTAVAYVYPTVAGLQDSLSGPGTVAVCDTAEYTLRLNATGIGNLYHVMATLQPPVGGEWSYVPGSSVAWFGGTPVAMEPNAGLTWNLDAVPAIANGFNSAAGDVFIRFKVRFICDYAGEPITLLLEGETYCGRPISFTRTLSPAHLDLPPLSTDNISLTNLSCGVPGIVTFDLNTVATTQFTNSVTVTLPAGFEFTGGGGSQVIPVPAGTAAGVQHFSLAMHATTSVSCPFTHTLQVVLRKGAVLQCHPNEAPCERLDEAQVLSCSFVAAAPTLSLYPEGSCLTGCTRLIPVLSGGSGQYSYSWTETGSTTVLSTDSIATFCPVLGSVDYTVVVTDVNGCTASNSYTIAGPVLLVGNGMPSQYACAFNVSCHGAANGAINYSVAGGSAPYTFLWSNGASTEDISGLGAGTYSVTATDANGCTTSNSFTLTQPMPLAVSSVPVVTFRPRVNAVCGYNVHCFGGNDGQFTVNFAGGANCTASTVAITGPVTQTQTGIGSMTFSNLFAGTYTILVTDANGCTASAPSVTLTQPSQLVASAGPDRAVNFGYQSQHCVVLTGTRSGGISPYVGRWNIGSATGPLVSNNTSVQVCPTVTTTYCYTVTDDFGCRVTDCMTICVTDIRCGTGPTRVNVCTVPPSNPGNPQTLCIANSQVTAHLAANPGSYMGSCGAVPCSNNKAEVGSSAGLFVTVFPNPFSEVATLRFEVGRPDEVSVKVYSMTGVLLATLFEGRAEGGVHHDLEFRAEGMPNGVYFAKVATKGGGVQVLKLILNK